MPENELPTITGFKNRIIEASPGINEEYAKRVATRLKKRMDRMTEEFDFFAELRILGIISDPTARDAIENLEAA